MLALLIIHLCLGFIFAFGFTLGAQNYITTWNALGDFIVGVLLWPLVAARHLVIRRKLRQAAAEFTRQQGSTREKLREAIYGSWIKYKYEDLSPERQKLVEESKKKFLEDLGQVLTPEQHAGIGAGGGDDKDEYHCGDPNCPVCGGPTHDESKQYRCGACRDTGKWSNGIDCPVCGGTSATEAESG